MSASADMVMPAKARCGMVPRQPTVEPRYPCVLFVCLFLCLLACVLASLFVFLFDLLLTCSLGWLVD